jgi:hypothetical protein
MHHAGGVVDLPDGVAGLDRLSLVIEIEEAARRIDDPALEEIEEPFGLIG